jgi:1,4-alpha-glucan branching enzyme
LVASKASDVVAMPQQFVLEITRAQRVSLVGDFNNWSPTAAPMTRSSDGGLWSVIVPILPGRHMYGFMVDDSIFVLDPRAQKARDPDLGTEGSVRMVGRP